MLNIRICIEDPLIFFINKKKFKTFCYKKKTISKTKFVFLLKKIWQLDRYFLFHAWSTKFWIYILKTNRIEEFGRPGENLVITYHLDDFCFQNAFCFNLTTSELPFQIRNNFKKLETLFIEKIAIQLLERTSILAANFTFLVIFTFWPIFIGGHSS